MSNYDNWLTKPYDDLYDAETTVDINCAELHDTEENWECEYEGDADACITVVVYYLQRCLSQVWQCFFHDKR